MGKLIPCLCKTVIRVVMSFFLVKGLVLTIVGGLILEGSFLMSYVPVDDIKKEIDAATEPLKDHFPEKYTKFDKETVSDVIKAFEPLGVMLLVVGLLLLVWSLTGLIIGCMKPGLAWAIYVVCMASVATVCCFMTVMVDRIPKNLLEALLPDYSGLASRNVHSIAFSGIMIFFKCCGVRNYKDFEKIDTWPPTDFKFEEFLPDVNFTEKLKGLTTPDPAQYNVNQSIPANIDVPDVPIGLLGNLGNPTKNFKTPIACCKDLVSGIKDGCFLKGGAKEKNNNMFNGCLRKLMDKWENYRQYFVMGLLGLGGLHAFMVILGVIIFAFSAPVMPI